VSAHRVLRVIVPLAFAVCALVATVAAATVGTPRSPERALAPAAKQGSRRPARTTASNRHAAVLDAKNLLAGVVPPAGAVLQSSGSGTGPHARLLTSETASAVAYSTWSVPADPASVLSYAEAHLPPGSKLVSTGSGAGSRSVIRSWQPVKGVLDVRWVEVEVTAHAGGTLLYAQSQSQWVVTRPVGERIPAGVRVVDVTSGWPGKNPRVTRRVTDRPKVRALVSLFNSLEILQPGAINCPAFMPGPVVVVTFLSAGSAQPVARASVAAAADFSWPDYTPGWACLPIGFAAAGRTWSPLAGNVVTPIGRLLHVKLDPRGATRTGAE
jgi:hypothetical protein